MYYTIKYLKEKSESCTLETIHAKSIEFLLKNRVEIGEGNSITKILPKLATFDKTTQEWTLKSKEVIMQEMKSKCKTKPKNERTNV